MIETPRLVLRQHTVADFEDCVAMWTDPNVLHFINNGVAFPAAHSWTRLLSYVGHWTLFNYGYWAVQEKVTGKFIGQLGFADFKREVTPSILGEPELGWALISESQGKGYATEALRAALSWGEKNLDAPRTVCLIHPMNKPSLRVADKLGFQKVVDTTFKGEPSILFEKKFLALKQRIKSGSFNCCLSPVA
ncbi:MAG: GNAT family N-acetyltransferase, partial [Bdellovibrionales bacterium]|nr:GNAT family N-acetyltransferase [Bdellovibrionales bacterium]